MTNNGDYSFSLGSVRVFNRKTSLFVVIISLFLVQILSHSVLLTKSTQFLATQLTVDDTYYYLETAWNHKTTGYPSFDGSSHTNGFHFLWYLILYVVALFVHTKYLLLRYAIGICALFLALPYLFFYLIGRKLRSIRLALFLSIIWFAAHIAPQDILIGLENSLHLCISTWVLFEVYCLFAALRDNQRVHFLRLTIALIVNAFCRVDSGLFSAVVFILSLAVTIKHSGSFVAFKRQYGRSFLLSITFVILAAITQFGAYLYWNNTLIPISGIIKMSGIFPPSGLTFISRVVMIFSFSLPNLPLSLIIEIMICLAVTYFALRNVRDRHARNGSAATSTFIILLISNLVYLIYVSLPPAAARPYWYYSTANVFWIFSICLFLTQMDYRSKKRSLRIVLHSAMIVFMVFLVGSGVHRYVSMITATADRNSMFSVRYRTSLWIRDNIPDDVVLAAWNAGQVGFFSEHSVINLDGLINSKDYFESVLLGRESLYQYLRQHNVKYLIDYRDATVDQFTDELSVFRSFLVTKSVSDSLYIWDIESIDIDSDIGYYPRQ